jgi:hypothetical protein
MKDKVLYIKIMLREPLLLFYIWGITFGSLSVSLI